MADNLNKQSMNCKNFVTFRNIFGDYTITRLSKSKDAAVFEVSGEDIWIFHHAD